MSTTWQQDLLDEAKSSGPKSVREFRSALKSLSGLTSTEINSFLYKSGHFQVDKTCQPPKFSRLDTVTRVEHSAPPRPSPRRPHASPIPAPAPAPAAPAANLLLILNIRIPSFPTFCLWSAKKIPVIRVDRMTSVMTAAALCARQKETWFAHVTGPGLAPRETEAPVWKSEDKESDCLEWKGGDEGRALTEATLKQSLRSYLSRYVASVVNAHARLGSEVKIARMVFGVDDRGKVQGIRVNKLESVEQLIRNLLSKELDPPDVGTLVSFRWHKL